MLRIVDLTLSRGTKRLLEGANLTVHAGHKLGLVGANGCGKSSLFAAIRGELIPDAGNDRAAAGVDDRARRAGDAAGGDAARSTTCWTAIASCGRSSARSPPRMRTREHGGEALADLHHRFEAVGGYTRAAHARRRCSPGLGFAEARHGDAVASFSGGWRMRLNLAQALMCRSDLLLLDEPTNHLDLDAVLWLEDWLGKYPGTLLLITHDRDFLDGVVGGIVHVDARKLVSYTGNYAQFERERALQLALQQATYVEAAAAGRAPARVHRSLPRQGHQGEAGAKPDQGARAHGAHCRGARRQPVRVHVRAGRRRTARQLVLLEHATLGYDERPPVLAQHRLGHPGGRPHRPARPQRRWQVDAAQDDRRHAGAA